MQRSYDCLFQNTLAFSCFESVSNFTDENSGGSDDGDPIDIFDGACCENVKTNEQLCCIVGITDEEDKASIQK